MIKILVYGTLKKGHLAHKILMRKSKFIENNRDAEVYEIQIKDTYWINLYEKICGYKGYTYIDFITDQCIVYSNKKFLKTIPMVGPEGSFRETFQK